MLESPGKVLHQIRSGYLKPALVKNLFVYCGTLYKSQVKHSQLPYFEYFHF